MNRVKVLLLSLALPVVVGLAAPMTAAAATSTTVLRAYFLINDVDGANPGLVPVQRTAPRTTAVATAAVRQLLGGPTEAERADRPPVRTAIPAGVKLLGLSISGATATVNLSDRFEFGSGALAMRQRIGQLTWTVTQFTGVTRVRLLLDGAPVTRFSSAGIVLPTYLTRTTFRDDVLPPMFVDKPAYRAAFPSGAHVTGLANVFEATFRVAVLDSHRTVLVDRQAMATCGTGCWGRFDVALSYNVGHAQWGWLRVYDPSEEDGSPEGIRDYRVLLTPRA